MSNTSAYIPPEFKRTNFHCPSCGVLAHQNWYPLVWKSGNTYGPEDESRMVAICYHCKNYSIWVSQKLILPIAHTAPPSNPDLPEEVKGDYEEARNIIAASPRGAAALLRLAIQKLCTHLGEKGKNINEDIAALVKKGLPPQIQQALDIVRVVGNNAVHPGQIDLNDNPQIANQLFGLVNLIAEVMITQPKHVQNLYTNIVPEELRDAIKKRDGTS